MKFSIKDFFSKCEQIRSFLRIWSHLPKKSLRGKLHILRSDRIQTENEVSLKQCSMSIKCNEEEQIPFTPPLGDS